MHFEPNLPDRKSSGACMIDYLSHRDGRYLPRIAYGQRGKSAARKVVILSGSCGCRQGQPMFEHAS
jgi:hypothetical protein